MIGINTDSNASLLQQVQQKQNTLFERLTSQVEGNRQAIRNAYYGISLSQVAESGLQGINQDAQRIGELTLQAGNGTLNDSDRQAIQAEITQLQENITQTVEQTMFGGQQLLTENGNIDFQVGANAGQQISVGTNDVRSSSDDLLNIDITSSQGLEDALTAADDALQFIGESRADLGAAQNQFESAVRNLSQADVNTAAARSRIQDTDFAQTASENAAAGVLGQSAISVQAQTNQQQGQVLALLS